MAIGAVACSIATGAVIATVGTLPVLGKDEVRQRHERRVLSGLDARARSHVSFRGQPGAILPNLDRTDRVDDARTGAVRSLLSVP